MAALFGTDGIRGQANSYPITSEVALEVGKSIAHTLRASGHNSNRAVIGKDTRLSGYMLETALTSGLVAMGMDVFLVGPVPTPAVAHLTKSMGAAAGIMLTASHNPYDDNGIKIFGRDGYKLSHELQDVIESHVKLQDLKTDHIRTDRIGKAYRLDDARGRYIEYAKNAIGDVRIDNLKIVLDCANGAAYLISPVIFKELGANVIKVGTDPDGLNINSDCGALHPGYTGDLVSKHGADVGISFDGDADRVVFCDASGKVVDGDKVLAAAAIAMKEAGQLVGDTVVVTVMSNLGFHEAMRKHGIRVVTTPVGDHQIIKAMREGGYSLGGENSGHIIFSNVATTGDGILSALQMLKLMQNSRKTFAQLTDCMRLYPQVNDSILVAEKKPIEELENLQSVCKDCDQNLGDDGRTLIRYSGTEKKLRLLVECKDAQTARSWMDKLVSAVKEDFPENARAV